MPRDVAAIVTVDHYSARIDVVKAHQKIYKSCFATTGRTDDRDLHSLLDIERKLFDQRLVLTVRKADAIKCYVSVHRAKLCIGVGGLGCGVGQLKYTLGGGYRPLQLGNDSRYLVEGLGVLIGV